MLMIRSVYEEFLNWIWINHNTKYSEIKERQVFKYLKTYPKILSIRTKNGFAIKGLSKLKNKLENQLKNNSDDVLITSDNDHIIQPVDQPKIVNLDTKKLSLNIIRQESNQMTPKVDSVQKSNNNNKTNQNLAPPKVGTKQIILSPPKIIVPNIGKR
jgi:hypothetical protein